MAPQGGTRIGIKKNQKGSKKQKRIKNKFEKDFFKKKLNQVLGLMGLLVLWSPGPLVPWSSGLLVLWSPGPLVPWLWSPAPLVSPLVLWSPAPLVPWSSNPLVPWSSGSLVLWFPGFLFIRNAPRRPLVPWSSGLVVLRSPASSFVLVFTSCHVFQHF